MVWLLTIYSSAISVLMCARWWCNNMRWCNAWAEGECITTEGVIAVHHKTPSARCLLFLLTDFQPSKCFETHTEVCLPLFVITVMVTRVWANLGKFQNCAFISIYCTLNYALKPSFQCIWLAESHVTRVTIDMVLLIWYYWYGYWLIND